MQYLRQLFRLVVLLALTIVFLQTCWAHRGSIYPGNTICRPLLPLGITCEERISVPEPIKDVQPGDLLVTFSTHTLGWRHGHAALVIDSETILEAVMPGSVSGFSSPNHWASYSSLLHLRVKDASAQQRTAAAEYAKQHLYGLPYGFFCGLGAEKAPAAPARLHCAYLPWYAWQHQDVDLDSDGGRIITVMDLTQSPHLEIISARGQPLPNRK